MYYTRSQSQVWDDEEKTSRLDNDRYMEKKEKTVIGGFLFNDKVNFLRFVFDEASLDEVLTGGPNYAAAMEKLKSHALNIAHLPDSDLQVLVSEKKRPYPVSPFDLMMLVAGDTPDQKPSNIGEVDSQELGNILIYAKQLLAKLTSVAEETDSPVVRKVISLNYHQNPLPEKNIDYLIKTYAQTLDLLHFHTFVLTENDLKEIPDQEITKSERDIVNDPTSFIMKAIMVIPSIEQEFSIEGLSQTESGKLVFNTDKDMDEFDLGEKLQVLHQQYLKVYQEILEIFVDVNQHDSLDMPLLDPEAIHTNIKVYIQNLRQHPGNRSADALEKINRLMNIWMRLAGILNPGNKEDVLNHKRLFLRSAAYTLVMEPNEEKGWKITLDPRLISTGNALHTLGYFKKFDKNRIPDKDWWLKQGEMVKEIRSIRQIG